MLISAARAVLVRSLVPSRWAANPDRAARSLKRFGDVEADSGWQYLHAIGVCKDHDLKRMLFENVLEEFKHADYFYGAAHSLATNRIRGSEERRTVLVNSGSDLPAFLAYANVCETAIHTQFDSYAAACTIPEVSKVFRDISADEESHGAETYEHLRRLLGNREGARWAMLKARGQRLYEAWMRGSAMIGNLTFYPVLGLLFFLFGPFLKGGRDFEEFPPVEVNVRRPVCAKGGSPAPAAIVHRVSR